MANTGYIHYVNRAQYMLSQSTGLINLGAPTGTEEPNATGTNYIADVLSYATCPVGTSFLMSYIPANTTPSAACNDQSAALKYHDGAGSMPANGDYIYTDAGNTTAFDGDNKYYKNLDEPGQASMKISALGYVSEYSSC